jgi:hypothetical protein
MKELKIYAYAILFNLIPIIVMRLVMGSTTGDENTGYVIFIFFMIIALLLNTSFFFIKIQPPQKNKNKDFLSYYLCSTFLFIIGTLLLLFDFISNAFISLHDIWVPLVLYYLYFIINFSFAYYIKNHYNKPL